MRTVACDLVGVEQPLFGFSRSPGVVAAVSRAGGLGVLPAHHYAPAELDEVLTWIDEAADGRPYGVDVVVPSMGQVDAVGDLAEHMRAQIPAEHTAFVEGLLQRYGVPPRSGPARADGRLSADEAAAGIDPSWLGPLLDVAFAHNVRLIANGLGTPPDDIVAMAHANGVAVAALVGSPRHVQRQLTAGVDLLVAQGTEAGGHTGTIATMVLTPDVVGVADGTPVLAAGGIASGRQMAAALALGAVGVWCGSVWLSTHEDITVDAVKNKLLAATSDDTIRSTTRTGKPARQLHSAWHDEWSSASAPKPLGLPLQLMLTGDVWERIDEAAEAGNEGAQALESFFIGQVVGSFRTLRPAQEVATSIIAECDTVLHQLGHGAQGDAA